MEYIVTAFRSRADTVKFSEILKNNRIYNEIINTPKEAGVGCGLSVKTSLGMQNLIRLALRKGHFSSFAGIFHLKIIGGKRIVTTI